MSLSANTAQTRELTELRNHLKWLDEERRKSGRKMAEIEQRLAQQGRELADRDQKIQELEWHIANFAERFERMPDLDTNVAGTEQRLQDLEWHLSNMNTQLTRQPNPEEERARLQEEITSAVNAAQEHAEAGQSLLESRLRSEIVSLRESDDYRMLASQQQEQAQAINEIDQQFAALQESVGILSGQLRERTVTLAAESQANMSSLAARFQDHIEAMSAEHQARINAVSAEWRTKLDTVQAVSSEPPPEILRLEGQLAELTQSQQQWQLRSVELEQKVGELSESIAPISVQHDEQLAQVAHVQEEWQSRWAQLEQRIEEVNHSIAPISAQQDEQLAAVTHAQEEWQSRWAQLEQRIEEVNHSIAPISTQQDEQLAVVTHAQEEWQSRWAQLEQRIGELNDSISPISIRQQELALIAGRLPEFEAELKAYHEDSTALATQLAQQLAQVEENIGKIGHIREIMPLLDRLEQELELRQAEEVRLSNLIGTQENRFEPLAAALEEVNQSQSTLLGRVSESERALEELRIGMQDFNDNWKPALSEANRRIAPVAERLTILSNNIMKAEAGLQALTGDQSELREVVVNLADESRRNQSEVARQLEGWQATLDENKDTIERFTQQWITLSNQYKEARMAVQNFAHWQKQLEQQKREASEMLRIESNRMQSRWDGFLIEIQEKLKNFELELGQKWQAFEMENEQKWSGARRSEQLWREELASVDELIQKLQQDNRNLIWRVQAAQADAIKKWPRLLMEEVEKAVELNPNRRLSSAGTTPRSEMSVVDAIEQGLITIDYNDDSAIDI